MGAPKSIMSRLEAPRRKSGFVYIGNSDWRPLRRHGGNSLVGWLLDLQPRGEGFKSQCELNFFSVSGSWCCLFALLSGAGSHGAATSRALADRARGHPLLHGPSAPGRVPSLHRGSWLPATGPRDPRGPSRRQNLNRISTARLGTRHARLWSMWRHSVR